MRQSISNFWHRRLGGLRPVSRTLYLLISFHFMLFSIPVSRPQRLIRVCDVFHDFDFISFLFRSPAFFFKIFFPSVLLSSLRRVRVSCAVTEGGHYSMSQGVAYPLEPCSPTPSRLAQRFHRPRLGSIPRFKRPPTNPSSFHTIPHFTRNPHLALSQENQDISFLNEWIQDKL